MVENSIRLATKGIVIYENKVLTVQRSNYYKSGAGIWEFPGGGIMFGETPEGCMAREIQEETGLVVDVERALYAANFFPDATHQMVMLYYLCRAKSNDVTLSDEHVDYSWADLPRLKNVLLPSILRDVVKYNALEAAGLISIRVTRGLDNIRDAYTVRHDVFLHEQGFSRDADDEDANAWHVVVYDGDTPVATGRTFGDVEYHIGRVAVLMEYRGLGIGLSVMRELETAARRAGGKSIVLSAQTPAVGFYEKLGYTAFGGEYYDEHCPHMDMRKEL